MRKLPTGTPDTGEPYVRCGGRGGHTAIPTPISHDSGLNRRAHMISFQLYFTIAML